ncbi:GNAT family N-acetyltransferase [Paenibacillus baekrokdamisoli]|nr:GNAT family N-acetyltransferase [Paenibacillus baekrokdamisoli]
MQINLIQEDGCRVMNIERTREGNALILYTTSQGCDIFARIVYPSGVATRRYLNDLAMFVQKKPHDNAYKLLYIRILGDKMNCGYGTLMMNQLLARAKQNKIDYIEGHMQDATSQEHDARLRHFYTKFGFTIDADRQILWRPEEYCHFY